MFEGYIYYGLCAALMALLALLGILTFEHRKKIIVGTFVALMALSFQATIDLLSRPRPVELMLPYQVPSPDEATILAHEFKEGEWINLLLTWDGLPYARYFSFPWDNDMAEQIAGAVNDARERGSEGVVMPLPFDDSLDRRETPWAHPTPTPKTFGPKPNEPPPVQQYEHPSEGA